MLLFVLGNSTAEEARILFTRRSTTVRSHKGQVSLAGGRREANDFSPAMTAIRELHEEVGIPPHGVTVIGMLPPIQALDQSNIYPVVGITSQPTDQLQPAAEEVAMLFAAPWSLFAQTRAQSFDFNIFGNWRKSWLFATPHGNVWGLTAQILHGAALA
jgi:8-oxo-dGTP pyrophosphatase MutT (NUDIX family)